MGSCEEVFDIKIAEGRHERMILDCLAAAFQPFKDLYTRDAYSDTVLDEQSLQTRMRQMSVMIAESNEGKVVGTIACVTYGREGHIRGMAVLPEYHGKGIAELLLSSAEQILVRNSCEFVTLDTTEVLHRAQKFYEKHGYTRTGQVRDFFGMRLIELSKRLPH